MGVVFRARITGAEGFSRQVAIKRIHEALARDPGLREALVAEARTAQRLHHGNIVQLIDVGLEGDLPYLVLEYVDGASLAELLRAVPGRPLAAADALHVAEHVAAALAYAHGLADPAGRPEGVVHRDVTPRNILISRDGVVKLTDFGIARALSAPSYTLPGTFKGSLGYLAPEQARGEPVDARADQFSLGIVLHEMLSGRNPIAARDVESYHRVLSSGVPALAAPPPADAELAAIVARATAREPAARYGSMDELRSELEAWRVARKVRTSVESLRDAMRERFETGATARGPRPLGAALGDQLPPSVRTERIAPAALDPGRRAAARRRGRRAGTAVGVLAGIACVAVVIAGRSRAPAVSPGGPPPPAPDAAARVAEPAPPIDAAAPAPVPVPSPAIDAAIADATPAPDLAAPPAGADAAIGPRRPPPRPGTLKVMVVPWATVLLDGRPLGGVPLERQIPAGRHRLTLHNPDTGDRVDRWIELQPGGLVEVRSW